ncbi:leucyl/phenylalanyl-tRNA--protein transferase [Alteromonas sp. KUL42]|uniref:leucyl/phenylalanyl-tRNA--protein transferase n=1 Tax=Alteromonas sp. KUL42 TaxID=2480797 RepID=UPI00079C5E95|nr:leucyl/phenylalanyl-tRNA--protein transferase [Alteromonas sp. KUL42]KXJ61631.1 MAG: leucyl/phenylalanyl-tRNA--protein transferase [Alteromonas sp. Nap_26]TAP36961.1 leucyl/phenylalanyl-tRNA--protein transferase [Alteromonas sp. KUL42]GEA06345.1 leucyl/phenylalanyl-tRNA--protein transferase [Alteromonas sp. KUL42]
MIALHYIENNAPFPSVDTALDEPNGLLAFGADLSPSRLFSAYSQGIFPWFSDDEPLLWWSPNPRAIIELDDFVASKSLLKLARKRRYRVTLNQSFEKVIDACSSIPRKNPNNDGVSNETWITEEMVQAYCHLHGLGIAHSVEVWDNETLVGGLYGVGIGKVFCGESMFHTQSNTSKLAMYALVKHMQSHNMAFIDCQLPTDHLCSLGAKAITRDLFIDKLYENNQTLNDDGELSEHYLAQWLPKEITP